MFRGIFNRQGNERSEPVAPDSGLGDRLLDAAAEGELFNERAPQAEPSMPQPTFTDAPPRQQAAPQPQQPSQPTQPQPQQAQAVYVPQGYETPAQLQGRLEDAKRRKQALIERLRTATSNDPQTNRYAQQTGTNENGQPVYGMNQVAYENDRITLSTIDDEIREVDWKMRDARDASSQIVHQVQQSAETYLNARMSLQSFRLAKKYHKPVVDVYVRHVRTLLSNGHLTDPRNLSPQNLASTFEGIFNAAVGEVMANMDTGDAVKPQGIQDPDMVKPGQRGDGIPDDDMADWPEESKLMMAAFNRHKEKTSGTLAQARLAEKQAAEKRARQQQMGGE